MMKMLLESLGYQVWTAGDIAQATGMLANEAFDLMISDLGLPDGTGHQLMHKIRASGSPLRAIALSGYGQEEDVKRSSEAGFSAHLVKPVDAEALLETVEGLFQ